MFVADDDLETAGWPDMRNMFLCRSPKQTACGTRDKNSQGTIKIAEVMKHLELYNDKSGIDIKPKLVYRFYANGDALHACMIGPLYSLSLKQINNLEEYAENSIPGVTYRNIGYHGKFHMTDDIPPTPFDATNEEKRNKKQDREEVDHIPVNISIHTDKNNIDNDNNHMNHSSTTSLQAAKKPKLELDSENQASNTASNDNYSFPCATRYEDIDMQDGTTNSLEYARNTKLEKDTDNQDSNTTTNHSYDLPSTTQYTSIKPPAADAMPTCCIKIWKYTLLPISSSTVCI